MTTATTLKPATQPTFPAQAIEASIRTFLAEEGEMQAVLHGGNAVEQGVRAIGPQPVIDSLVVVEVLLELETQVPFELPESLVRAGGYDSVDEVVQHLLPKIQQRWNQHYKEKI
jgi:acyl carrier protein